MAAMADPYLPALADFAFTDDEQAVIDVALATVKPWDWEPKGNTLTTFKAVKTRIRDIHMQRHNHRCCYCRRDLHGAGHFMIDREHVLPKSLEPYRQLAFEMWNLGTSCKRCNMEYKGDKDDFVIVKGDPAALQDGANYRLIHPNFDRYKDHISRSAVEDDDVVVVTFTKVPGSAKAEYTYDYFNLAGLERQIQDQSQGAFVVELPSEGGLEVRRLAESLGQ